MMFTVVADTERVVAQPTPRGQDGLLSLTVIPSEKVPAAVGVPEMTPVEDDKESPEGILPEVSFHV